MTPTKSLVYMYKYLSTVYKEYQVSWDLVYKVKIHALLNISNHHLFLLKKKRVVLKIKLYPTIVIFANLYHSFNLNFTPRTQLY